MTNAAARSASLRWSATLALAAITALALLVPLAPAADAQYRESSPRATLHRTEIVEGQTRTFEISSVGPDTYYLHVKPLADPYTAEANDLAVTTPDGSDAGAALAVGGFAAVQRDAQQRIRFDVAALTPGSDDEGDETFGVQLCTTSNCQGGTILGDWTITMTDAPADTTVSGGSGVTVTIPGTSGDGVVSVMEVSANGDNRDQLGEFILTLDAAPTQNIVIVARADTSAVFKEADAQGPEESGPIARPNAAASQDELDADDPLYDTSTVYWEVARFASGTSSLTTTATIAGVDNVEDTPALSITGNLEFRVLQDDAEYNDATVGNATVYGSITIPNVPIELTGDNEHTVISLGDAATADNIATEASTTDTAKFRVTVKRGLGAGETLTVPIAFAGATLGTHFTLALDGSHSGVAYADANDGSNRGMLTFTGPSDAEATLVVTAATDDGDTTQNRLRLWVYKDDQTWRRTRFDTNMVGGVCAGDGCIGGFLRDRQHNITLNEPGPGLRIIDNGDGRLLEPTGSTNNYEYQVRLNTRPTNNVTVTVTTSDTSRTTIAGDTRALTFTLDNPPACGTPQVPCTRWDVPRDIRVFASTDSTDEPEQPFTVTHTFSGDATYAALAAVTHDLTFVDNDPTSVVMAGDGVRANPSGNELSRIMIEGDATRVDATLTISLGRALADGEYLRVPLLLVAQGHDTSVGGDSCVALNEDGTATVDLDHCESVETPRGPRYSANVSWPTHYNDFEMAATGTGVSLRAMNRRTPAHTGYRYLEFSGAGAQTATIHLNARDGFDDGEGFDESIYIIFNDANPFANPAPVVTNLSGGVDMSAQQAWFYITDDDDFTGDGAVVPDSWLLLPTDLEAGDKFRLIYVTSQETAASSSDLSTYDAFVRTEITGNGLVNGGVTDLAEHATSFKAIGEVSGTSARDHASFSPVDTNDPNFPIYWVNGSKVADDNADFTDDTWDDEANPRYADGTLAMYDSNSDGTKDSAGPDPDGYWTGTDQDGATPAGPFGLCQLGGYPALPLLGAARASVGYLNIAGSGTGINSPIPRAADANTLGPVSNFLGAATGQGACRSFPNSEMRPMYALSGVLTVVPSDGVSVAANAAAAEGSDITFTVTLPEAAPSGGIMVPYTLSDGRGISSDPAYIVATSADYTNTAGSVTIAQGATTATFTVATANDNTYEGTHYFTVTLGTPSGTNAPPLHSRKSVAAGAITDAADAPTLAFSAATATVAEGDGSVDVTVEKTGTTLVPASVRWTTADGTGASGASHPTDYTAQSGYLEFAPDDTTKTLTIPIVDDSARESAETFKVQLDSAQVVAAKVGSTAETTVTVTDDDAGGDVLVSWSQTDDSALPGSQQIVEGDTLTVKVSLSQAAPAGGVTIPLGITLIPTHAAAADFTIPTSVRVTAGQTSATFEIEAAIDEMLEENELVNVTLCPTASCPQGYTSGMTPPSLGVIIADPGVVVDASSLTTSNLNTGVKLLAEGGSGTFTIALEKDPTVDATISFKSVGGDISTLTAIIDATASDHIGVDTDPDTDGFQNTLTFTGGGSGNWMTPQTVRIYALYDDDANIGTAQNDIYTIGVINMAASGPYKVQVNTSNGSIRLTVPDAGHDVVVSPAAVEVANAETVEYDVQLASDPGGTVVVTPTSSDTSKATVSGALTFTSDNWGTPQQVTVTGAAAGMTTITHAVTTATTAYPVSLVPDPVSVTVTSPLELTFAQAAYTVVEGDGSIDVTVTADTAPASPLTVNLTTGNGTTQGAADFTAPPATFTFPASMTSHTITINIANDGTKEVHERFRLTLASGNGYSVGTPPSTDVTILNDDGTVNVTLSKSGGDANGNIVEGASDGTEYIDITVTLGRVLRGGDRITAGIFFTGAARNTDYTLALHPSTQTGVSLYTSNLGSSLQNPGVQFAGAGAWRATLRLTAVDNDDRTQPFVHIRLKTDTNARVRVHSGGLSLGTVHTVPLQFVIVDDETGDIVVPEGWSLAPSGVAGGEDFRLFFMTSTERNANPTNIAVYDNFIRSVIVGNGHADIKPYAGFFKVFGSTSTDNARVHNEMWAGSAWTDASKTPSDAGTPIYWLNGRKVADNYWDFCDESWDNRNHSSGLQVRLENGTVSSGRVTPRQFVFTGTNMNCTSGGNVLGANNVKVGYGVRGSGLYTQGLHHGNQSDRTKPKGESWPFWAMSPVFTKAPEPELTFSAATYSGAEGDGTIDVTVSADRAPSSALTVTLGAAGVTATGGSDYTAPGTTFTFPASQTSHTFSVAITDDSTVEGSETFTLTLTAGTGYGVGTQASTTVTITDNDALSITMAGTDGDANGNAVENASGGTTGYRTITLTLGAAPATGKSVTVPLSVVGATVTTDYTFALSGTNTGVTLDTSAPHSAQDPAVVFAAGATAATLRLTPEDNDDRTQPYVVVGYGTGARAPSATGGIMLAKPSGAQGVVLVDDETGAIEVLTTWGLAPSGLAAGNDFRLLFRTSTGRDATSSDIAVYDAFVRSVLAGNGHEDIKPYAGFFKVFGGTRVQNGSTGTSVRVHNGMASTHTGHHAGTNDVWADDSTRATVGSTEGTPTYWLNGVRLANNYADMCDVNWSGGNGVTTGWGRAAPRSEDGTRNVPANVPGNNFGPYSTWTGSGNACEAWIYPLGAARVSRSSAGSGGGQSLLHQTDAASTGIHPFYGYSPVFTLQLPPPVLSFGALTYSGREGDGTIDVTVTASRALTSALTVNISAANGTAMGGAVDFTNPPADFTFSSGTSHTISVAINNDSTVEQDEDFTLTLGAGEGYTLAAPTTTTVTILDDDGISVEMTASDGDSDGNAVEGGAGTTGYRTITLTLSRALTGQETVTVPLSVTGATVTTDYTFALSGTNTGVTLTTTGGTHTAQNPAVQFASGATTATLRLTPVDNNARTQPYVIVAYGTGGNAPSATGGISLGTPRGGPIGIVLVDDETGDIVLPAGADFRPQVGNNAEYRMIFMTSEGGPATSTDIADYDHFVRSAAIRNGDAALLPYVGFFRAFVSTATVDGREHVGIWDPTRNGGSGGYADGSTGLSSSGTDVYWLGGASLTINNYFRVCNREWDSRWSQTSTRLRHEDGTEGDGAKVWTGMDNNCVTSANPLGSATPTYGPGAQAGSGTHSQALSLGTEAATNTNRFYAVSDVVKTVASADMPEVQFSMRSFSGNENDLESDFITVTADPAPAQDLTIAYTYADSDATEGEDYTGTAGTLTIPAGQPSVTFKVPFLEDDIFEDSETFRIILAVSPDYLPGSFRSTIVTILDDDEPEVGFEKAEYWALEGSGSVDVDLTLDTDLELDIRVTLTVSGTATAGSDYTALQSNTVTIPAETTAGSTHTITIPITDDSTVEPDETIILEIDSLSSVRAKIADQGSTTVFIADEDTVVGALLLSPSTVTVREGESATYRVRPATAPTRAHIQVDITGQSASTLTLDADDAKNGDQAHVRFDSTNWWIGRTITVRGVHDSDLTDNTVTLRHATAGGGYDAVAAVNVTVTVDDEDVTLSIAGGDPVTEGSPAEVTVTASPAPDDHIEVKFSFTDAENADFLHSQFDSGLTRRFDANRTEQTYRFNTEADSVNEPSGPITITLEAGDSYAIDSSAASAMVQVNDDDGQPPVTVTMAASHGDANGNAVEGASNNTGHRTITITLGRALTGSETVTVPLTVDGATVTTDYTFALEPSTQTGVTLNTSSSNSAQNPAVVFAAGATTATLRLTPVDNNVRSQPYVVIAYGTDTRVPSASNATLGAVSGGPFGVALVDNETGDIEVPANWALAPAGLSAGDEFRLMFITSQTRTAASTDIDVYNTWAQGVVAAGGHASLLPYGGLVKVVGSTTSTDARVNTGMWDPTLNSNAGGHPDGSTSASDPGVKIYWLAAPPNGKVADNYFDFYDDTWVGGDNQRNRDRTEDGEHRTPTSSFWTGSTSDGQEFSGGQLGTNSVRSGSVNSDLLSSLNTTSNNQLPMLVMSPVFKVEAAPVVSITAGTSPVTEGTAATFTVSASPAPAANLTVNLIVDANPQFSPSPTGTQTVTIPTTGSVTFTVSTSDDTVDDENGAVQVAVDTGSGYTVSTSDYSATVLVHDDDATPSSITLSVDDNSVSEGDSAQSISVTATVDGSTQFGFNKAVTVSVTALTDTSSVNYVDMMAVSDFDIEIPVGASSHSRSFTLTPNDDVVDETDNTVTVSGSISGDSATTINSATIALTDDDATPSAITLSASPTTITEDGGAQTITVTATVSGTRFGVAKTVVGSVTGHNASGKVPFSPVSNFNISIAAEAASGTGTFSLIPTDNSTADSAGEAAITGTLTGVTISGTSVAITDDDGGAPSKPTVGITYTGGPVSEGSTAQFTLTVSPPQTSALFVRLRPSGGANFGIPEGQNRIVTIPAGATTHAVSYNTVNNNIDHPNGTLTVRIVLNAAYVRDEQAKSAQAIIEDNDATPTGVTVSASPLLVTEDAGATEITVTVAVQGSTRYGKNLRFRVSV